MNAPSKTESAGAGRENFVSRLYQMLSTPEFAGIVSWNETDQGPSFVILDTAKFQERVLVNEFNHANFSSFVRQLNKYDFHKVKFRDAHSRVWEFRHPHFRPENRDKPYLIKRKQQSSGRRLRRGDSLLREQADVAAKAAELAASNAEGMMHSQVTDLETRVMRLEENSMQFLSALKMQQKLVERLLRVIDLPDEVMEDLPLSNLQHTTDGMLNAINNPLVGTNQSNSGTVPDIQSNNIHRLPASHQIASQSQMPGQSQMHPQSQMPSQQQIPSQSQSQVSSHGGHGSGTNENHLQMPNNRLAGPSNNQISQQMLPQVGSNLNANDLNINPRMGMDISAEYAQSPAMSPGHISASSPGSSGPLVLTAVDNDKIREVLAKLLIKFGCRVESVDNGIDVVQKVENQNYDFILIDCILKALDGVSAVELIRQSNKITPIILMSDRTSNDEHETFLSRGVSTILYRPFNQTDLYSALREYKLPQTLL